MSTTGPILTDRQALIALAQAMIGLQTASGEIITFDAAIQIVAGAVVKSGASDDEPGQIGALSLSPIGRLRVETDERVAPMTARGPWGGRSPWAQTT